MCALLHANSEHIQKYVAEDMLLLDRLKNAEERAAPGPHVQGPWEQYPVGSLPDIDPAQFMGDAPFRNATSLPEFHVVSGATQLSEQAVPNADDNGDSILRCFSMPHF